MHLKLVYRSKSQSHGNIKLSVILFLFRLIGYRDSNYIGDSDNGKSVMEYYFFVNGAIISWCSKKEKTVSISTIMTKYIAFRHVA